MGKISLENVEKLHETNSGSFKLLPEDARRSLRQGDFAKLLFSFDAKPGGERMWVRVEVRSSEGEKYLGILSNKPVCAPDIDVGDPVCFGPENVLSIMRKEEVTPAASESGNIGWTHRECNDPEGKTRCWGAEDN